MRQFDEKQFNILKAQSALRGRILQEVRDKIGPLVMGLEDDGDRIYLGSTNDKDWLTEIEETIFEVDDEVWATLNQEEKDPYADLYNLRVNVIPDMLAALHSAEIKLARYMEVHGPKALGPLKDTYVGGLAAEYEASLDLIRAALSLAKSETPQ